MGGRGPYQKSDVLTSRFKSIDISVVGRASFWYALPHPLSPVTQSTNNPPNSPSLVQFTPPRHPRQALMCDGDSLRRSFDEFLSQVMLMTDEE